MTDGGDCQYGNKCSNWLKRQQFAYPGNEKLIAKYFVVNFVWVSSAQGIVTCECWETGERECAGLCVTLITSYSWFWIDLLNLLLLQGLHGLSHRRSHPGATRATQGILRLNRIEPFTDQSPMTFSHHSYSCIIHNCFILFLPCSNKRMVFCLLVTEFILSLPFHC